MANSDLTGRMFLNLECAWDAFLTAERMWNLCCQNVLGEKALESIIWQQYLLSGEQTNSCTATEWHPRSLKQHTTNLEGSYLHQMLFVSDTQLGENLSPVTWNRASSLLYLCSQQVLKNIFNTKLDCITFLHTELFIFCEKKTAKSSN